MQEHLFAADVALDDSNNVITSQWSGSGADADASGNESGDAVMERRVLSPSDQNFINLRITVSNSDVGLASASPPGAVPQEEEKEASTTVVLVNADATVEVVSGVVVPPAEEVVDDHPDTLVVSVAPDESLDDPQPVADPRGAFPKSSAAATSGLHHHPPPTAASTSRPTADPRGAVPKPPAVVPPHPRRPSPPTSTPMRSRTSSVSSVSSTASSWSTLSLNSAEQHQRWASEFAFVDALSFPPPPNPDVYQRMTEAEAEAEVEKWEKEKSPVPPLPLFYERAVGKAGFKIRSQAINDVYRGWQVSAILTKTRSGFVSEFGLQVEIWGYKAKYGCVTEILALGSSKGRKKTGDARVLPRPLTPRLTRRDTATAHQRQRKILLLGGVDPASNQWGIPKRSRKLDRGRCSGWGGSGPAECGARASPAGAAAPRSSGWWSRGEQWSQQRQRQRQHQ